MKFLNFFLFTRVMFALPDPNPDPLTWLNTDPTWIRTETLFLPHVQYTQVADVLSFGFSPCRQSTWLFANPRNRRAIWPRYIRIPGRVVKILVLRRLKYCTRPRGVQVLWNQDYYTQENYVCWSRKWRKCSVNSSLFESVQTRTGTWWYKNFRCQIAES